MCLPPPSPTLFPYTTLFRSSPRKAPSVSRGRPARTPMWSATSSTAPPPPARSSASDRSGPRRPPSPTVMFRRSEEHTSELQSLRHLVCRLLLEKKKDIRHTSLTPHKEQQKYMRGRHPGEDDRQTRWRGEDPGARLDRLQV